MNHFKPLSILLAGFIFSVMGPSLASGQIQDGTLDLTFGSGGKVVTPIRSGYDSGYGVAIQW